VTLASLRLVHRHQETPPLKPSAKTSAAPTNGRWLCGLLRCGLWRKRFSRGYKFHPPPWKPSVWFILSFVAATLARRRSFRLVRCFGRSGCEVSLKLLLTARHDLAFPTHRIFICRFCWSLVTDSTKLSPIASFYFVFLIQNKNDNE